MRLVLGIFFACLLAVAAVDARADDYTVNIDGTTYNVAVTGGLVYSNTNVHNITSSAYGATGDSVTNDLAAIQAAIDAAEVSGGAVYIPPGNYLLSGSGVALLTMNRAVKIFGDGYWSRLYVASDVPDTTDVLLINPTSGEGEYVILEDFGIWPTTGEPARHGVHLKSDDDIAHVIKRFYMNRVYVRYLGGRAVYMTNPAGIYTGTAFTSEIANSVLCNGVYADGVGDSFRLIGNTIPSMTEVWGVEVAAISGASSVSLVGNNITAKAGAVKVTQCDLFSLSDNNLEMDGAISSTDSALVYIEGNSSRDVRMAYIVGNTMNSGSTVRADCIKLDYVHRAVIDGNSGGINSGRSKFLTTSANTERASVGENRFNGVLGDPWDAYTSYLSVNAATNLVWRDRDLTEGSVTAKTADYVITAAESGDTFVTEGTTGDVFFTLPTAVAGLNYTFIAATNVDTLSVRANTGDTVTIGASDSALQGRVYTITKGNAIRLVATNATRWVAVNVVHPVTEWVVD